MRLSSRHFENNQSIPEEFAFGIPDPEQHVRLGANRNPHLCWDAPPAGTRSLALLCVDPDAPSRPDDVNREDREVPADLPRADFYHWAMVDIPASVREIDAGTLSEGVTARGKAPAPGPGDARQGRNSYTDWFAGDESMAGEYHGYDGPCPPWNDSIPHRYVFTVYALDVERCPVGASFDAPQVLAAIEGHVLAQAALTGTYTLNPRLRA